MTTPALRASLTLLGAAALVASGGCGSSVVTDRDATLRLQLGDPEYSISPQSLRVRSGPIRIIAHNRGRLTHNIRVEEATDVEGATPIVYGGTQTMQPGETAPGKTIRLLPGRYRLVCTIGNHQNLGQYADLEVTRAGT